MNILTAKPLAKKVCFEKEVFWVEFMDGRKLCVPLTYFPRLLQATESQRNAYEISGGGTGLHWNDIDEDICVEALLLGIGDRTQSSVLAV